jgi:TATA-binding protein-associated factor
LQSEDNIDLQSRSAQAIANLIELCSAPDSSVRINPSDKLVNNLCAFLCQDVSKTPIFATSKLIDAGILSLRYKPARGLAGKVPKIEVDSEEVVASKLVFRGAQLALTALAAKFESKLLERVPKLWGCMSDAIVSTFASGESFSGNEV